MWQLRAISLLYYIHALDQNDIPVPRLVRGPGNPCAGMGKDRDFCKGLYSTPVSDSLDHRLGNFDSVCC
ncbi:unnamed protein product [Calypogeia fissa]